MLMTSPRRRQRCCLLAHSGWAAPAFDRPIWEKVSIEPFYGDPANFPNSKPVVLAFNDWLAVADYSANKELAAEWLKVAFSKENNNKWNETMGLIPARNDLQYGYEPKFANSSVKLNWLHNMVLVLLASRKPPSFPPLCRTRWAS